MDRAKQEFLNTLKQPCIKYGKEYSILPSLLAVQAIRDSDWGTSNTYRMTKNHCQIRTIEDLYYEGQCYSLDTQKVYDNVYQSPEAGAIYIKYFSSYADGIEAFAKYLSEYTDRTGRYVYSNLEGCSDYKEALNRLYNRDQYLINHWRKKIIDPAYISDSIAIIELYKLYDWDKGVL